MNERVKVYDEKMQKSIHSLEGELATISRRTCESTCIRQNCCRLLWKPDTNPASGQYIRSGTTYDSDSAVGEEYDP